MTALFISYSRSDLNRVRELHAALTAHGKEVWVDWEGIPPTAEWMHEIRAAIDAAQAFAFVLSPASLASKVCLLELEHALARGKRLIPIVARDVDAASVHEPLARLNWFHAREQDPVEQAADRLITAIETDFAHVEQHTRLLLRAAEWEARGTDDGLALRGRPLAAAEAWLADAALNEPAPTALHTRFVLHSRAASSRRRLRLLGGVALALAALLVLGVVAWIENRNGARQAALALASRLAAESELARNAPGDRNDIDHYDRALLLAAESARTLQASGLRSLQTDLALRRALALRPQRVARLSGQDALERGGLAVLADGTVLTVAPRFGLTRLPPASRDDVGAREVHALPAEASAERAGFSSGGALAVMMGAGGVPGRVELRDTRTFVTRRTVEPRDCVADEAKADDAGTWLVVNCRSPAEPSGPSVTRFLNLGGGGAVEALALRDVSAFAVDPAGRWIAASTPAGLRAWSVEPGTSAGARGQVPDSRPGKSATARSGDRRRLIEVELDPGLPSGSVLAASPDGQHLLTSSGVESFVQRTRDWRIESDSLLVGALALGGGGRWIAGRGDNGDDRLVVVDPSLRREVARLSFNPTGGALAFDPGGSLLAVFSNRGNDLGIDLWRLGADQGALVTVEAGARLSAVSISADESEVLAAGASAARAWSMATGGPREPIVAGEAGPMAYDAEGRALARVEGPAVVVREAATGRVVRRLAFTGEAQAVALAAGGQVVAVGGADGVISVWTGDDKAPPQQVAVGTVGLGRLAVASDGGVLAAWPEPKPTRSGRPWKLLYAPGAGRGAPQVLDAGTDRSGFHAAPCALSADHQRVAIRARGGVAVREVPGGRVVATVDHRASRALCAFSADGRTLAVTSGDVVRVWALNGPVEVARIEGAGRVEGLAFSPSGRALATIAGTRAQVWLLEPGALADLACARVESNLDAQAWRVWHGERPYRPTCPERPVPGE